MLWQEMMVMALALAVGWLNKLFRLGQLFQLLSHLPSQGNFALALSFGDGATDSHSDGDDDIASSSQYPRALNNTLRLMQSNTVQHNSAMQTGASLCLLRRGCGCTLDREHELCYG